MKGFSIITNFGCKTNCSYCIWKSHPFYNQQFDRFNWLNAVKNFIKSTVTANKFSISGGGDPLNNLCQNRDFWETIIDCCATHNKKFDIHTSYLNWGSLIPFSSLNKMVFHSSCDKILNQFPVIEDYTRFFPNIRINFVVTNNIKINILKHIESRVSKFGIQLAYREYVGPEKISNEITDFCRGISERYSLGRYVEQADYNVYLFPDSEIYDKYLF